MKKLTRILTMGGFGLLAALATGAGPANAATANSVPESKSTNAHQIFWRDGEQIVGYYRTLGGCELAGNFGERVGNWDAHNCSPVRIGLRRGAWALQVASYDNWDRLGFGIPFRAINGFPIRFRPIWPGVCRPGVGFPGHGFPGHGFPGHGFPGHGGPGHGGPGGPGHGGPGGPGHGGPGGPGHGGPGHH
ncbi:hypothetical protein ODJ79_00725 [Actinoplanes sp. KI2]|uniref:hypothetical protein n=1 Tax=Actinoplanes sp. KI2 TaxID=2983315 RepID=UPI0021D5F63C|nr:hypothetical protein [Actinoplanes sp. KI2]MCU7722230.1 hypothetical protein [Actinoplanes sp. KI2]